MLNLFKIGAIILHENLQNNCGFFFEKLSYPNLIDFEKNESGEKEVSPYCQKSSFAQIPAAFAQLIMMTLYINYFFLKFAINIATCAINSQLL